MSNLVKIHSVVLKAKHVGQWKNGERQPAHHEFISCTLCTGILFGMLLHTFLQNMQEQKERENAVIMTLHTSLAFVFIHS